MLRFLVVIAIFPPICFPFFFCWLDVPLSKTVGVWTCTHSDDLSSHNQHFLRLSCVIFMFMVKWHYQTITKLMKLASIKVLPNVSGCVRPKVQRTWVIVF